MNACVICQHETAYFVWCFNVRTFLAQSDLDRGWSPVNEVGKLFLSDSLEGFMDLSSVDFSLNNVENWHVFPFFRWCAHHDVSWVQQSPHNIEHWCFLDIWGLLFNGQRCIASHQEMTSWSRDQGGQKTCHIIVHVTRITKRSGWSSHNSWDQRVYLTEIGIGNLESFWCNLVKSCIIKHNNRIWVVDEPL